MILIVRLVDGIAFAAGLTIPSGSTVNVNGGTLEVGGDVSNAGTLQTTTGTVGVSGNYSNSGTYTPGTGTLKLTGASGTQDVDSGGTAAGKLFYNLTHPGVGTARFVTNDANIDGAFSNTGGTFNANGRAMNVAGNWTNTATFTPSSNTVTLDGTAQSIFGDTTFYTLSKTVAAADTLTFENSKTQTVTNSLTLQGAIGQLLTLNSDDDDGTPTQFNITLQAGGLQSFQYLKVKNSNAGGGLTLVAGSTSVDLGNNTNWVFGAGTYTWTGSVSTNWNVAGNWDLGAVPGASDTAIVVDVANDPVLVGNTSVGNITIQASANLSLNGNNLTVSGTLTNNGTVNLYGSETVSLGTHITTAGTFDFTGDNDGISETFTLPDFGATDYFNITINDTSLVKDSFQTNNNLTVAGAVTVSSSTLNISTNTNTLTAAGTLTVNGGTLTATNGNIDANGNIVVSSGTLTAPTTAKTFTVAGNITHSGGTFTHSSGTVTLDGTNQTLSGNTTFYNLTKTVVAAATLTFDTASTQTVSHALTLTGASGQLLSIVSTAATTQAALTLSAGGTQSLQYLDVRDSNAGGGLTLVARNSQQPNGNNTNWVFGGTTITWDGSTSTDWDDPTNWDLGIVPGTDDTAVIASVANDPTLSTNVQVNNLTINAGATVTLAGKNLTVNSTLSNNGTVSLYGSETVTIATPDTNSGTFVFTGDGDGTAEVFTISDIGTTDFYNVTFNDANATKDTFRTNGALTVAGAMTVTAGSVDISTNANTLTTTGTLTVNGGTLTATNGNIDANGNVTISSGTLTAPTTAKTFSVAGNFTHSGGTFTHSSGNVTFDTAAIPTIAGDTTFYDLSTSTAGKTILFTAGTTQTVNHTFTVTGASGNNVVLNSTSAGSKWDITFPNGSQTVQFVTVQDSDANTNVVNCFSCTNGGNNNANWVFQQLSISVPQNGKTTDTTPTIIGLGPPATAVTIKDISNNVIATVVPDANGNFRVEATTVLATGANSLTPFVGVLSGAAVNITVVASPTTDQQPTITFPTNGARVLGATPTISGKGLASTAATILASDATGSLLLSTVGTGATDASGNYSITLTTSLPKGTNYLSVTIDGVATNVLNVTLTDPFGVVFDSVTNQPVKGATVTIYKTSGAKAQAGTDLDAADQNPYLTLIDGAYSYLAANGDYHIAVSAPGYTFPSALMSFPGGRSVTTGSKGETFTVAGVVLNIDIPVDSNGQLLRLTKEANKSEARIGEVVTYTVNIENRSTTDVTNVYIEDKIPPGFKYLNNRVTLDGIPISDPSGNRPLVFNIGTVDHNSTKVLKYQLVIGAGVEAGNYNNSVFARYSNGTVLSNRASKTVKVMLDPLFDMGTVVGKVFFDRNENGIQDEPTYAYADRETIVEDPVPNVQIMMEDGTVVTTDAQGQYHVPSLNPGRHLFRLNESTLPQGSYLTTNKVVILDVTPGSLNKVNFGVNLDYNRFKSEDQEFFTSGVNVTQDKNTPKPRLNVKLVSDQIPIYNDLFLDNAEFHIFTNYVAFINTWKLDILDADTDKLIRRFEGNRFNIFDPILWDGKDSQGERIKLDRHYKYILTVRDKGEKFDQTVAMPIEFREIKDKEEVKQYRMEQQKSIAAENDWFNKENAVNALNIQNILIQGETLIIYPLKAKLQSVQIMDKGVLVTDVPVRHFKELTAKEIMEQGLTSEQKKAGQLEVILPKGQYEVLVQEQEGTPQGKTSLGPGVPSSGAEHMEGQTKAARSTGNVKLYSKEVKVGDEYLMFVAMGDARIGYTLTRGNVEPAQAQDKYQKGFWQEGKLSYYLKGKILGKYLVTSSFDSERERQELFKAIDPNAYYPIYGDGSSLSYDATNTQGNLYVLIEWDKSSVRWGNYTVDFKDTEFAKYTRTLYGGKVNYESLSTTKYGDSRTKVAAFRAKAQQRASHNEFLATGGSLYYLKHKDIIEGSDKVKVEVRDKITGLVIAEHQMKAKADYEIDYNSGRIIFWRPVPILVDAYSIISNQLLNGNLVYVITDYEYHVVDKIDEGSIGARVRQAVSDNVLIGGTYVKESQESKDYRLTGTDVTIKVGPQATVTGEFAQSAAQSMGSFVSTDGGLSFSEIAVAPESEGKAYGIKGDARLFNRLGVDVYYKWIDNDFSTSSTTAQQGKELKGFGATWDITDTTHLTARQDIQTLVDDGNLQTTAQVGATRTATSLVQIVQQLRKLELTAAYQHQEVTDKSQQFETQTNQEVDTLALRAKYEVNKNLTLSAEQQSTLSGEKSDVTTLGFEAKPIDKVTVKGQEVIAKDGNATIMGVKVEPTSKLGLTLDYTVAKDKSGAISQQRSGGLGTNTGGTAQLNDSTTLQSNAGLTQSLQGDRSTTLALGATSKLDENTSLQTSVGLTQDNAGARSTSLALGGTSQVDKTTQNQTNVVLTDTLNEGKVTAFTFGTKKKISNELELTSSRTFGTSQLAQSDESGYGLTRVKDGRQLQGSIARKFSQSNTEVTSSNIFGLSGEIDDRWAMSGSFARGKVQNLDGTQTLRNALSLGLGYVNKNEETGASYKSSTKLELVSDQGDQSRQQYLIYQAVEGKLTPELTAFLKIELSRTRDLEQKLTSAQHKEINMGFAYRPIMHDRLNLLGRFTYVEGQKPTGQVSSGDIEQQQAHIFSIEGIYDLTSRWQISEKLAYRIGEEKVAGFDFNRTHTWLLIHRLNYKIDKDWLVGAEFRILTQEEAKDTKRGFLIEGARRLGDYGQLGVGYNFSNFDDDLTALSYTAHGPFIRMTGAMYDRTPEELERSHERWLEEKIEIWAWQVVREEMAKPNSPVVQELNEYFYMAHKAHEQGNLEQSQQIYRDIIKAGEMMFQEAAEYIYGRINKEETLQTMKAEADQYYRNGQYEKAKKILEKILEEVNQGMLE